MMTLRSFALLPALGRVSEFCRYGEEWKRLNTKYEQIEIKVINKGFEVWIPVDYCLRGQFSDEQKQIMLDNVA